MGADPNTLRRDRAQQRIERRAGLALMDGIDPDQHAIRRQELRAHFIRERLVVNRGRRVDAERGELFEDAIEAVVPRRYATAYLGIAAPKDRDLVGFLLSHRTKLPQQNPLRARASSAPRREPPAAALPR
jgi:hypothetical protein